MLESIKDFVLDLLFPKKCLGCQKEGTWFCQECFSKIVFTDQPFYYTKPPLSGIIIVALYQNPLKEAIFAFKYEGVKELAPILGELFVRHLNDERLSFVRQSILIPIPLYKMKLIERGFNQAALLAQEVAKKLNLPLLENALIKIKNTRPQIELKEKERRKNIKGAFKFLDSKRHQIKNKTILLVDDVTTTGATLEEAAKVLKKAGAKKICGLVLAKG